MWQLLGRETQLAAVRDEMVRRLESAFSRIADEEGRQRVHKEFSGRLWRGDGKAYPFRDTATGEAFEASIAGIDPRRPSASAPRRREAYVDIFSSRWNSSFDLGWEKEKIGGPSKKTGRQFINVCGLRKHGSLAYHFRSLLHYDLVLVAGLGSLAPEEIVVLAFFRVDAYSVDAAAGYRYFVGMV